MFGTLCYKDFNDNFLSFRYMQAINHYESNLNTIDEGDFNNLIEKIHQIYKIKKVEDAQSIIDTITNIIRENSPMANLLIKNGFNSFFTYLLRLDTNTFYCSLYDLLSEIFINYDGNFDSFVTQDILDFLNILSDENSHIFVSNLRCISNLLNRDKAYRSFFIESGGYYRLLTYEIHNNILEDKIKYIFNIISRVIEVQNENDLSGEYVSSLEEQNCILEQILKSLKIGFINISIYTLVCLDIFIRTSILFSSIRSKDELLIYNKEKLEQIKAEVMKNIRLNNDRIAYLCLDIIILLMNEMFEPDLFDVIEIQTNILLIFKVFRNSFDPIIYSLKLLTKIANDVTINEKISDDIISSTISFCESDAFKIKSESVHFLSTLIQMTDNLHACYIVEKYPVIIEIFCDFLHTKETILDCVISSLGKIVDLSMDKKISINVNQIFRFIDIGFLKELQVNYETIKENLRFLNLLSGIRYLISIYNQLQNSIENML